MFALNYREFWGGVSKWLTDELDQMVAAAQAKWFAEHDNQGAHTDVTANSVTSDAHLSPTLVTAIDDVPDREVFTARIAATNGGTYDYSFGHAGLAAAVFALNEPIATFTEDGVTVVGGVAPGKLYLQNDAAAISPAAITLEQTNGSPYTLYVESGKLYIVSGTVSGGGTVVGTQT